MHVVILGSRERPDSESDTVEVHRLVDQLADVHKGRLVVFSAGCDRGIGKAVREYCMQTATKFVEMRVKFEGKEISRRVFVEAFRVRNEALLPLGDEFYFFLGGHAASIVDCMVERATERVGKERVFVYEPFSGASVQRGNSGSPDEERLDAE